MLIGCSEENYKKENDQLNRSKSSKTADGSIPSEKMVFEVIENSSKYSLDELIVFYKKDMKETKADYLCNLQNLWFSELNSRLAKEGKEDMKIEFLNTQIGMPQNLANIEGFYDLLISIDMYKKSLEAHNIASTFNKKNRNFIESLDWSSETQKDKKLQELNFQSAMFYRKVSGR